MSRGTSNSKINNQNQVSLNIYHIHWYLRFKNNLYLPDNLNENMQIISFVLKSGLWIDDFWKKNYVWCSMLHFIFISSTFFTLYKLLKLRRESYPRILSSKNRLFPPLTASLSRNGNRKIVADKCSKFQGMYTCKKVVKIVFHYHLYFLGISKVYNILHQWSVDRV